MKWELIFALIGLVVVFAETGTPTQIYKNSNLTDSLIECQPVKKDKILYSRHLEDTGSAFQVKRRTVVYPEKAEGLAVIHCIRAIDNNAEFGDEGGSIYIRKGGLNQTYVTLEIVSKRGKGYSFDISIYGR